MLSSGYRHSGIGVKFLNSIYADLYTQEKVFDITGKNVKLFYISF